MSLSLDTSELEGDVEDFEGDTDLNEWAAMGEDGPDILVSKLPQQSQYQALSRENRNLQKNIAALADQSLSKSHGAKQGKSFDEGSSNTNSLVSPRSPRPAPRTAGSAKPEILKVGKPQETATPLKRKASCDPDMLDEGEEAKTRKMESDILMAIEDPGSKSMSQFEVEDKDQDEHTRRMSFSPEELRSLDSLLVSEMMGGVKKQMFLRMAKGDRYVVTFAPVELADLAQVSVQKIIESQPNLAFFFNRQGKFKKKKGYAQAYFSLTSEVRSFINRLMYVTLSEKSTEISVSAIMNSGKHNVQVSFVLSSSNKDRLLGLLDSGEDPSKSSPSAASFQLERISADATSSILMLLFPFASKINFNSTQAKSVGDGYKGPVDVYYLNQRWLDAMLACCSDFRYNGSSLNILLKETQKLGQSEKFSSQSKREKKLSEADRKSQTDLSGLETLQGAPESSRSRHSSGESNTSGSEKGNDDISNMTLDVCAGMMESLDKLKEMGTDNPNILRILEMQSQLASLQNSLKKKNKRAVSESPDGPSKVESKPTRDKKEDKKKCSEMEREERNKKEVAALEAKLQESDKKEKEREQRLKEEEENQRQRNKELEERRKTKMTREMIEEAKQKRQQGGKTSEAAQRILQSIADKHHDQKQKEGAIAPQQKLAETGSDAHPLRQWSSASSSPTQVRGEGKAPELDRGSFEDNLQPMNSFMKIFPGPSSSHHRTPPLTGNIPLTPSGGRHGHIPLTPRVGHPGNIPLTPSGVSYSTAHLTPGFRGHPQSLLGPTPRPAGPDKVAVPDDDGLHSRLEEFQKELAQQGVVSPVKVHENSRSTISPDRPLHEGVPVYTEKEFHRRRKLDFGRGLPHEFYIQTTFLPNRKCPVYECPASKVFKTEPMFLDHWDMFHKPTMTMRFCRRCTAYFSQPDELHAHLIKAHGVADLVVASSMVAEARVKVVNNPSYRDPGRFLAPPV